MKSYINITALFLALICLVVLINRALLVFSYNPDIGGIEETFVYFIQKFSLGIPFFGDPENVPYNISQYAPAYFFLLNKLSLLIGINPLTDIRQIFILGRFVNLVLNIAASSLLFLLLNKKLNVSKGIAAIFAMFSFCLFYSFHYAVRPDSAKNFVFIIILIMLFHSANSGKTLRYIITALLMSFCISLKQDAIAFIPAGMLFYLGQRDYKALRISAYIIIPLSIVIIIIFFQRNILFKNLVLGLNQGIFLLFMLKLIRYLLLPRLSILFMLFLFSGWRKQTNIHKGLTVVALFLFASSLLFSLKWGATPAYYAEFFTIFLIILAIRYDNTFRLSPQKLLWGLIILPIIIPPLMVFEFNRKLIPVFNRQSEEKFKLDYYTRTSVVKWVLGKPKSQQQFNVLTFDKPLTNHLASKCIFPTYETEFPEYMFCQVNPLPEGFRPNIIFNYYNLIKSGELHSIPFFITSSPECDSSFLGINMISEKHLTRIGNYFIYDQ